MTRPGAPTPPSPHDTEYVRKLALAILSTLQSKGLLSAEDVDAILIAARRAAQGQPERSQDAPSRAPQITVQPPVSHNKPEEETKEPPPPVIDIQLD